jgi:RNA polymerase sigma factor (sigma-70 family)
LTARIARGDSDALGSFYESWFDRSFALARGLTRRDESFCLDVVQDAMLRVARSMKRIETEPELERWMARVVHTAALDRLRAESRRVARERRRADADARAADSELDGIDERVRWLRAQLASLGPEERTILALRYVQGRTLDETGHAVGLTGDAVHGKLRRLMRRLRSASGEENDDG